VHVGNERWDARFRFSFWHNGVALWDVNHQAAQPPLLEEFRQVIGTSQSAHGARGGG
jgi:hypothetical protein